MDPFQILVAELEANRKAWRRVARKLARLELSVFMTTPCIAKHLGMALKTFENIKSEASMKPARQGTRGGKPTLWNVVSTTNRYYSSLCRRRFEHPSESKSEAVGILVKNYVQLIHCGPVSEVARRIFQERLRAVMLDRLYSLVDAAEYLGKSVDHVRKLVNDGKISSHRFHSQGSKLGRVRIPLASVIQFRQRHPTPVHEAG